MTRENKLALIVAFALILGVSVLLSDHLSSARTAQAGEVRETTRLPDVPERSIRTLDDAERLRRANGAQVVSDPTMDEAGAEPAVHVAGSRPTGTGQSLIESLLEGLGAAPSAVSTERTGTSTPATNAGGPLVLNQASARQAPGAADAGAGSPALSDPVRAHEVRSGESLYSIAARYYGDGNLWRDLARFNTDRVKTDGTVNIGVSLRIPSRADLTRRPGATPTTTRPATPADAATPGSTAPGTPAAPPRQEQPRREQPATPRTYTVARGDTLGEISQRSLGTSRRWREIYNLNKEQIADPNNVRAGIVLVLPAS